MSFVPSRDSFQNSSSFCFTHSTPLTCPPNFLPFDQLSQDCQIINWWIWSICVTDWLPVCLCHKSFSSWLWQPNKKKKRRGDLSNLWIFQMYDPSDNCEAIPPAAVEFGLGCGVFWWSVPNSEPMPPGNVIPSCYFWQVPNRVVVLPVAQESNVLWLLLIFQDFLSLPVSWFLEWKSLAGSKLLWFSVKCFYVEGGKGGILQSRWNVTTNGIKSMPTLPWNEATFLRRPELGQTRTVAGLGSVQAQTYKRTLQLYIT